MRVSANNNTRGEESTVTIGLDSNSFVMSFYSVVRSFSSSNRREISFRCSFVFSME